MNFWWGSSVETFLEYLWRIGWRIVKLAIIAFVFSRLGRTETIVVSILGTLYVMISFDQLSRHFALKEIVDKVDDLTNEFTRILELVGEDRETIKKRKEARTERYLAYAARVSEGREMSE
jgi:hypothetical protein